MVAAAALLTIATRPLCPCPRNVFFVSSFVVVELTIVLGQLPLSGIHELAHLLAGRRLGLSSRIRLSNRFYFVVFETTLDGLVGVPRRQRYLPMLAGMGADVVVMAALTIAAGLTPGGSLASGVCLALAFSTLPRIVWQCYFFLQTDIYYLVTTVLGCIDLHATSRQWLANRLHRASGDPSAWSTRPSGIPNDRRAARWYGPLMVAGYGAAAIMAALVALPLAWHLFGGAARALFSSDAGRHRVVGRRRAVRHHRGPPRPGRRPRPPRPPGRPGAPTAAATTSTLTEAPHHDHDRAPLTAPPPVGRQSPDPPSRRRPRHRRRPPPATWPLHRCR